MSQKSIYKVDVFTGIRPTGVLTIANVLGAVKPLLNLQSQGLHPMVFVADMHGMTDCEPKVLQTYVQEVVADYIALGLDPTKISIFVQSQLESEISFLTLLLMRHITVSELTRIPTLKDKLRENSRVTTANALLAVYPVMMAADILLQRAKYVPVGDDQMAHLEITRLLAKRFNKRYAGVFPFPKAQKVTPLRILSLFGEGKMSKSNPQSAIFLTDKMNDVALKIKKADTCFAGEMSDRLLSHFTMGKLLAPDTTTVESFEELRLRHIKGEKVMGEFKSLLTLVVQNFLRDYQQRRAEVVCQSRYIADILEQGAVVAKQNARETISLVKDALYSK